MKTKLLPQLFIIYLRYALGFAFVFASIVKILGLRFTSSSGADFPINTSWHFFETMYQSGLYWKFMGWGQLITGLLLLTQKYAKLGAILFLPIMLNIFVITISYDFKGTPFITASMLLANILLIAWDWNTLKVLIHQEITKEQAPLLEHVNIWMYLGWLLFGLSIALKLVASPLAAILLFFTIMAAGIIGSVLAVKKYKKLQYKSLNSVM
ncbi:hypothetical protein ACQY1Q_10520 [Tenacibaculum sp. TC6]|uniref:hypothetical protein n=1 Tax=Tenacibaculum sp. TC6 TaxID=3423223 RepID=UPI003D35EB02